MASTDTQGDIYITVGEGFFIPSLFLGLPPVHSVTEWDLSCNGLIVFNRTQTTAGTKTDSRTALK